MTKRVTLRLADVLPLMRHLADVAALSGEPLAQRKLLVDGLNRIIGTNQAFFFVADGWSIDDTPRWAHQSLGSDMDPVFLKYMAEFGTKFPLTADPYAVRTIGDTAAVQAFTRHDVVPDLAAEKQFVPFMDLIRAGRVTDGVVAYYRGRLDPTRIVGVGMHNFGGARRLNARQVALARLAMEELRGLNDRGHLPLPSPEKTRGLSPRLRQVLDRLLAGDQPKSISKQLGLSIHTVREHVGRLYKHFAVSGRDELMAKFLKS